MEYIQIFALALLQGLTEFLPISSSAHLILLPVIAGWEDQGLAFDIAVHVGSLTAVVFYFRKTLETLSIDWVSSIKQRSMVGESRLAWALLLGTVPVGLSGLMLGNLIEINLRNPLVIATATILFGLIPAFRAFKSSPPDTTSTPAPNLPKVFNIVKLLLDFAAKHTRGLIFLKVFVNFK